MKLEGEGPSYSTGGSYAVGVGAGDLTNSRCFTWSSVLLLGGDMSSREKAKRQCERRGWQRALWAAASAKWQWASLTIISAEGARGRTFMARGVFTMAIFILLAGLAPAEEGAV